MTRLARIFLFTGVLLLLAATAAHAIHITHGPIVGRPESDSMGIWARTNQPGKFRVVYQAAGVSEQFESEIVTTKLEEDCTGHVVLTGLHPDTRYIFHVLAEGMSAAGPTGSFRTLPDTAQFRDPELNPKGLFNFSFEYACGNNQDPGQGVGPSLPAFKTMLENIADDIHFAILNGDWLYEEQRTYSPEEWRRQTGIAEAETPAVVRIAPTITGVWENYKLYLSRGYNLAQWHRHVPSLFMYDDHEILNDIWGAGTPGLRDRRATFRDIGVEAWYHYLGWSNPVAFTQGITFGRAAVRAESDILIDDNAAFDKLDLEQATALMMHWGGPTAGVNDNDLDGVGGDPNAGVYRIAEVMDPHRLRIEPAPKADGEISYSIGRRSYFHKRIANCDFFVCDTRGQRQMHDTKDPYKKGLSHLGLPQRKWLMEGTKNSDADFIFVFSTVNFMVPHIGGGKVRATNKDDAWTVFYDEREMLIDHFDSLGKRVFLCTGDLHNCFVARITENVWEFAAGPHNSANHILADEGGRPVTGKFKYGPRECDIRWSTGFRSDVPRDALRSPSYCVVQVNNVHNNSIDLKTDRWVAFERPQVIFQYFDGRTGKLRYAESLVK